MSGDELCCVCGLKDEKNGTRPFGPDAKPICLHCAQHPAYMAEANARAWKVIDKEHLESFMTDLAKTVDTFLLTRARALVDYFESLRDENQELQSYLQEATEAFREARQTVADLDNRITELSQAVAPDVPGEIYAVWQRHGNGWVLRGAAENLEGATAKKVSLGDPDTVRVQPYRQAEDKL